MPAHATAEPPLPDPRSPAPRARRANTSGGRPHAPRRARVAAIAAIAAPAALLSPLAAALEFECSLPGDTRFLRVDIPGESRLCEVSVTGENGEGERRVPWYADNETLFCSAKAYELRDKYVEQWGFECRRWPDGDGVDLLSGRQRAILDAQLKSLLAEADDAPPPSGVRAVASTPFDGDAGMLALQFLEPDGGDRIRLIADSVDDWQVIVSVRDLPRRVDPVPGLRVHGAFIESISPSGALEVLTLLEPAAGSADEAAASAPCEGRQTLRAAGDDLVPSSPHRHFCSAGPGAYDPG